MQQAVRSIKRVAKFADLDFDIPFTRARWINSRPEYHKIASQNLAKN